MVKYVKGDLFSSRCDVLAHGCNCRGGYGSGVAYAMAKKYPKARESYLEKFEEDGWKLGEVQFVVTHDGVVIANCATQASYLPRGICHANYPAIRVCMTKVKEFAKVNNKTIAIPKIGAGLAGGDWNIIEGILNEVFDDYDVTVYYLE
ncbi:MAG: macro domain-containing protein [Candidatus Methanoperedens sp.]|nr:macro domain-containing protein [Candidatus Methanoperedens sp.]